MSISATTTRTEVTSASGSKLRVAEFDPEIGALWIRKSGWVDCTTATIGPLEFRNPVANVIAHARGQMREHGLR